MKEKKNYWTKLKKKFRVIPVNVGNDPGSAGSKGKFRDTTNTFNNEDYDNSVK